jgi:hypothetical protein
MNEELIKQLKEKVKGLSREDRMMVLMMALANLHMSNEKSK